MQEGREVVKKKAFVPPPRFMNVDEARYLLVLSILLLKCLLFLGNFSVPGLNKFMLSIQGTAYPCGA